MNLYGPLSALCWIVTGDTARKGLDWEWRGENTVLGVFICAPEDGALYPCT